MKILGTLALAILIPASPPQDQGPVPLDVLVQRAVERNPSLAAARHRARAAQARIAPAGALPDPVLSLALRNFPASDPGFADFMTMKTVGLSQLLPYPGKRSAAQTAALRALDAAHATVEDLRLELEREVRHAYYELVFFDRALEVVARHTQVLSSLTRLADTRYGVGTAGQEDVLKAQVEEAALADEAARLTERRRGALARLNSLLDQPPDTPVGAVAFPEWVVSVASRPPTQISFTSLEVGARVADSPLRPLDELLRAAVERNPSIELYRSSIEAQRARLDLVARAHLPDLGVALSYGQRDDRTDMLSLSVSMPLPVNRGSRQDPRVDEAEAELAALEAVHRGQVNELQARVSEVYADVERDRTGLALLTTAMLPRGTAALQAATAGFQVARTDFLTVLANQTTLFQYETSYHRTLADFAQNLAKLERLVGEEVLR